jgi:hypothetical protein
MALAAGWSWIPAGERSRAVIFTQNYGQAGAIARFGPPHGLPMPYSGRMSFAEWGPPPATADGFAAPLLTRLFARVPSGRRLACDA